MTSFRTLVFMDLESTDLLHTRPGITELALIACSVEHFQEASSSDPAPRVLQKLTLCFNPKKTVVPEAIKLSGLDNFLLENESEFDVNTIRLLVAFLDRLQKPISLVAHNGYGFDFPLLARMCREHGVVPNINCSDSLVIFKNIDSEDEKVQIFVDLELENLLKEEQVLAESSTSSVIETERAQSPDIFMDDAIDDETLTQVTMLAEQNYQFQSTPDGKTTERSIPPKIPAKVPVSRVNRDHLKPRRLFSTRSYKLTEIHKRFFGAFPKAAHRAEDDTETLLVCARHRAHDFLHHLSQQGQRPLSTFI